jgi:hypothetical protein
MVLQRSYFFYLAVDVTDVILSSFTKLKISMWFSFECNFDCLVIENAGNLNLLSNAKKMVQEKRKDHRCVRTTF